VQLERAGLPEEDPRQPALMRRERVLHEAHQRQWSAPLRELGFSWVAFRRGFVDEGNTTAPFFQAHAAELFAAAPLRHLGVLDAYHGVEGLARCPHLARLRGLSVNTTPSLQPRVEELLDSPHLADLVRLDLSNNRFPTQDLLRVLTRMR